jgi:hypothetical protein
MFQIALPKKYAHLLDDADVRRWYENLQASSIVTATVYLRTLGRFCMLTKTTPQHILDIAETKAFRDMFIDFVRQLEREGKAGSYIVRFKKVLHSWLTYNNITVKLRVNIRGEHDTPTLANERIPSKEELARILRLATLRARISCALMAFSGLRPQTLGNYQGTDGLRLSDFPEAEFQNNTIVFPILPSQLRIRSGLSKARHQYLTFVPQQTITFIHEYIQQRVAHGETLNVDTPLLGFDRRGGHKNAFLRTTLVTRDIKEAIINAGYTWRPHVLRAYFDTNMIIAESKGSITHPYVQFFMGHKGDMEARYTTNKARLPPDMIEDMRQRYEACEPFLSTLTQPLEQASIVKQAKIEALKSIASSLLGIDLLEVKVAKEREQQQALTVDEEIQLFENEIKKHREPEDDSQIIVHESELETYLADDWEFVSVLPSQKILIRK